MAIVYFYEKPGCINNTRQKHILAAAGHEVVARDLMNTDWNPAALRRFFGDLPVARWFNPSAPAIKQGRVDPAVLGEGEALALMLDDPLLIRRPLLQVGNSYCCGFDWQMLEEWIGLALRDKPPDLENCPRDRQQRGACR